MNFDDKFNKFNVGGALIIGYIGCSYLFFRKPHFLWTKQTFNNFSLTQLNRQWPNNNIFLIAHRGGAQEKCENTIQAFQHSVDLGVNMIETDVVITKDQRVAVFHDTYTQRLTGVNKYIDDVNFNELQLQKNFKLDFCDKVYEGEIDDVPSLEQVFLKYPDTLFNVEIKNPSRENIIKVDEIIRRNLKTYTTVWGVKSQSLQPDLTWANEYVQQFCGMEESIKILFYYLTGSLPFMKPSGQFLQIPLYSQEYENWQLKRNLENYKSQQEIFNNKTQKFSFKNMLYKLYYNNENLANNILKQSNSVMFSLIKLNQKHLPKIIEHLNLRGHLTFAWVLNNEEQYQQALDLKVHGIMTDKPSELKEFLIKNNKYQSNEDQLKEQKQKILNQPQYYPVKE